ncbi:hypothetical protein MBLNU457_g2840t2 [Dothideomycetes sp. NU457]
MSVSFTEESAPAISHTNLTEPTSEFRKRSLPAYLMEAKAKEAVVVVEKEKKASISDSSIVQQQPKLSFFQKYFCRPTTQDPEQSSQPENLRFSFLSLGFLVCSTVVTLAIVATLVAALVTQLVGKKPAPYKAPSEYKNSPIREAIFGNFPDPAILLHDSTWYALATNNIAGILKQPQNVTTLQYALTNVQLATSPDFLNWTLLSAGHDPLPEVGDWANNTMSATIPPHPRANVWAPAVLQRPSDGHFVLYYSATAADITKPAHCVGAAVTNASTPAGPYTPVNVSISCPLDLGGAIDPAPFVDHDNTIWLAWKVDGNNAGNGGSCGNTMPPLQNTPIKLVKMMDDGITPDGPEITILDRTAADGPLVEAPSLVRSHEGIYFLFFSSGCTRDPSYDVKYATASSVTGPYTRAASPLLQSGDWGLSAPGSASIAPTSDGGFEMAFHARVQSSLGGIRAMFTSKLQFNGTKASLVRSVNAA